MNTGAKYKKMDVYGEFHVYLPAPMYAAFLRITKERKETHIAAFEQIMMGYLEKMMEPEDFQSLKAFIDTYYPAFKSKEVIAFWENHLGLR